MDTEFQPTVTATCKAGYMTIRVNLNQSFVGAVHARDYRRPQCMVPGNGSTHATLGINLLAPEGAPDYCGVLVNNVRILRVHTSHIFLPSFLPSSHPPAPHPTFLCPRNFIGQTFRFHFIFVKFDYQRWLVITEYGRAIGSYRGEDTQDSRARRRQILRYHVRQSGL